MTKQKTIVAIIVYNRFSNIKLWLNCWKQCDQTNAKLVVIHNYDKESDQEPYKKLCESHKIKYIPRLNKGFDIGAFRDVCNGTIKLNFDNLIWITDDTIPMAKDFVSQFTRRLPNLSCIEISNRNAPIHVRTTGFCISKEVASKLKFGKLETKLDCYEFEHRGRETLLHQVRAMRLECIQLTTLDKSPLWDTGNREYLNRMKEHEAVFKTETKIESNPKVTFICPIYNNYPQIISSLICQTYQNWELLLIHDGKNETGLNKLIPKDKRIKYSETKERIGNWGHKIRSEQIKNLTDSDYVVVTNPDNYHAPVYIEYMLKGFEKQGTIATYCSHMVHSYKAWQIIECRMMRGFVDCAGVMIKTDVAKQVGWNDVESHSADWFFFNDIIKKYGIHNFNRVLGCLLIHN